MTKDKALKMALEALESPWNAPYVDGCDLALGKKVKAITAIKEALAQPEHGWTPERIAGMARLKEAQDKKLSQPEQEYHAVNAIHKGQQCYVNTQPKEPEQEPVAWVDLLKEAQQIVESKVLWKRFIDGTPLSNDIACWMAAFAQQHTTPPQRTWAGLTDEEIWEALSGIDCTRPMLIARAIEAKLKENNS